MTSLDEELSVQARWDALANPKITPIADSLLRNEFAAPEVLDAWTERALTALLQYAGSNVPYYRDQFAARKIAPEAAFRDGALSALPLLTKTDLYEHAGRLLSETGLKPGERDVVTLTSGTTGRPTRVFHTDAYDRFFALMKMREYRWFRFDPTGKLAIIRLASQLPRPRGRELADGETLRLKAWPQMESLFQTGPLAAFNITNPVEAQIEWLREEKPDYLVTYSESLEHLSFAAEGENPAPSVKGMLAISEQLTPDMRRRIEQSFNAPINQNYGLNEIGVVASRCHAGRYHVHLETCFVELLDEEGAPQRPGRPGRIVVTALRNRRMPLIRYDTDDLAEVVSGPCPCGRTLPAFGEVSGRYSRIAYLPDGTLALVGAIRSALEEMPAELSRNLRQFQVHQSRDNRFELRLGVAARLPEAFAARIRAAWDKSAPRGVPLSIVEVARIPRTPGGKFQDFTSDFMPHPEDVEPPEAGG